MREFSDPAGKAECAAPADDPATTIAAVVAPVALHKKPRRIHCLDVLITPPVTHAYSIRAKVDASEHLVVLPEMGRSELPSRMSGRAPAVAPTIAGPHVDLLP